MKWIAVSGSWQKTNKQVEDVLDKNAYYDRNTIIVENSDELAAFQVNNSEGVQDAIDKAGRLGMKIHLYSYMI